MSQTVSPSTSRCYGLARVSRAWSVSRAGRYAFSRERRRLRSPVAPVRQALVRMLTWPIISVGKSTRPTFTAKAIAKYGRDCALSGFARAPPRAPGDGRERLARAPSRRAQPREDARRNHRHRQGQRNVGNGREPDGHPSRKGGPIFSSPSNTRTQKSSAFTPRVQPIASRR
jgi:hypothetical protein